MVSVENEMIGRRLQDIRQCAHMGYYDMAKLLGVTEGHYRKIERGIYGLDVPKLVILYEKLDVDPLYLLAGCNKGKGENLSHSELRRRRVCELLDYCRKQIGEDEEV